MGGGARGRITRATGLASLAMTAAAAAGAPAKTYDLNLYPLPRLAAPLGLSLTAVTPVGDFDGDGHADLALTLRRPHVPGHPFHNSYTIAIASRRGPAGQTRVRLKDASTIELGEWEEPPEPTAAGDVNGDGIDDLVFSHGRNVWLVLGARGRTATTLRGGEPRVSHIRGVEPVKDEFEDFERFDTAVAAIGDENGDGRGDLAIGSPASSPDGRSHAGRVYLIHGTAHPHDIDLTKPGAAFAYLDGPAPHSQAGAAIATVGDFDGDGRPEIAIRAKRTLPQYTREAIWVTDAAGPSRSLGSSDDTTVLGFDGQSGGDIFFTSLAAAGDVDRDGRADLGAATDTGNSFLIFGAAPGGTLELQRADSGYAGFRAPTPPTAAGDVDGDGLADFVVGGRLVLGADSPLTPETDDKALDARGGWKTSSTLVPIGDRNGDGRADLVTHRAAGVPCWAANESIVFIDGAASPPAPPFGHPTKGPDVLTGSAGGDIVDGGRGNDRLSGKGGDDCLTGGADFQPDIDSVIHPPKPDRDRLYGGRGDDYLDGGGDRDLLVGGPGDDQLYGGSGRDVLLGGSGNDLLIGYDDLGDPSRDRYDAGPGDDTIDARDYARNRVDCGPGHDRALVDPIDTTVGCEDVHRHWP